MSSTATNAAIRLLRSEDRAQWGPLWDGYLRFYRHALEPAVTERTFGRLCAREEGLFGLVAHDAAGRLTGFAHALEHASTWAATSDCYLEDLFVDPAARGGGTGRALIEATAAEARSRGCERLHWQTQQFNAPARSLYDTLASLSSYVVYERALGRRRG